MNILQFCKNKTNELILSSGEKYTYSDSMEISDKCFLLGLNLYIFGMLFAIPCVFLTKNTALGIVCLLFDLFLISQSILIYKSPENIILYKRITCIFAELLAVPIYLLSGGQAGNGLFFTITVIIFAFLVLSGTFRIINTISFILLMLITVLVSVNYPQLCQTGVIDFSPELSAFLKAFSCLLSVFFVITILYFQMNLYNEQGEILKLAKLEADQANAAKSMFLANMSHEIRTPMGVIIGLSEMIQHEDNIQTIHGMSSNLNRTAGMLLNVINDILDYEKIKKGKMDIVNIEYFTDELISDFRTVGGSRAEMKGINFSVSSTPSLPSVLFGDELRLRQIGTNIINNALKYTEAGSIDVLVDFDTDREMLILTVKDTGKGIKAEDLPYIFDSFQRVDLKNNRHIEGTGLGLSITKKLSEAMGGKVEAYSEYGKGSTFIAEVAHKKVGNPTISKEKAPEKVYHLEGIRTLYVDDTKINTIVFNGLLKGSGIKAEFAFSGPEALELVKDHEFDVIFLDYLMPGMDGIETLKKMKSFGIKCPIIVITADAVNNAHDRLLSAGFDDFLSKPVKREKLLEVIEKYTK